MSRQIVLEAVWHITLLIDGEIPDRSDVRYTKEWIDKVQEENPDFEAEGRVIIGCSYTPLKWIAKAVKEAQEEGKEVFFTHEEHVFGRPDVLQEVIVKYWDEWHAEDPRWPWNPNIITEFFKLYQWAIIYIYVY